MFKHILVLLLIAAPALAHERDARAVADKIGDLVEQITKIQKCKAECEADKCDKECHGKSCDAKCTTEELPELQSDLKRAVHKAEIIRDEVWLELKNNSSPEETRDLAGQYTAIFDALKNAASVKPAPDDGKVAITTAQALNELLTKLDDEGASRSPAARTLSAQLIDVESQLRAKGIADRQKIGKLTDAITAVNEAGGDPKELIASKKKYQAEESQIQSLVTLPTDKAPLYRIFEDDEEAWVNQFYAGIEFDDLNGLFSTGFARIGYDSTVHLGTFPPESHPRSGPSLRGDYGAFFDFSAGVTTTAESSLSNLGAAPSCKDKDGAATACTARALEGQLSLFVPIYRTQRGKRLRHYFGPVIAAGLRHATDSNAQLPHAEYRYYGGFHFGFARDAFSELLIGRTSNLHTRRLELRGEIPVATWGNGNRVILGAVDNIRLGRDPGRLDLLNGRTEPIQEHDVFRVYVVYEIDFLKLFGITPPK